MLGDGCSVLWPCSRHQCAPGEARFEVAQRASLHRRELQTTASSGKHIYPKLAVLPVPPDIMVSFFSAAEIEKLVATDGITLNSFEKIEIFETAGTTVTRMRTQLRKLQIPEAAAGYALGPQERHTQ